jgi:hypothetical protein
MAAILDRRPILKSRFQLKYDLSPVNWFLQSICLDEGDFQYIVDKLEKTGESKSLRGVDVIWVVTKIR